MEKTVSSPGSLNISMNGSSYLWQHIDKVTKNKKKITNEMKHTVNLQ